MRIGCAALVAAGLATVTECGGGGTTPTPADQPAALAGVPLTAGSVVGGNPVTGNATLTKAAPAGGAAVALSSSNAAATVPGSVTIPAGAAAAGYTVTTSAVSNTTPVTITGTYLGVPQTASLSITPAAVTVRAVFTFTADAGTTPPAGQCSVTKTTSGSLMNVLRCRFDATSSTPNPGITEYRWQFPGAASTVTGPTITDPEVPCGTFSAAAQRSVVLTVTAPQGTNSVTTDILFVKGAEC